MTYFALAGVVLIVVLAGVIGVVDARTAPRWRNVAAERRREWEATHLRDDYPTGPQPLSGRR